VHTNSKEEEDEDDTNPFLSVISDGEDSIEEEQERCVQYTDNTAYTVPFF
jgi:hypothetical protein